MTLEQTKSFDQALENLFNAQKLLDQALEHIYEARKRSEYVRGFIRRGDFIGAAQDNEMIHDELLDAIGHLCEIERQLEGEPDDSENP